jgi:hypothetical protein
MHPALSAAEASLLAAPQATRGRVPLNYEGGSVQNFILWWAIGAVATFLVGAIMFFAWLMT